MRVVLRGLVVFLLLSGAAKAGVEEKCSVQYSLEEHLILEWAALGGDPHAQFAVAQCAFPDNRRDLTDAEKVYAMKWLTLATCDADGTPGADERDRLTRKLKLQSDISFRRFGGVTSDEKWTAREKELIAYRNQRAADVEGRFKALQSTMSEGQKAEARDALADQLARMGGIGLMRLADLTGCRNFAASKPLAAASYAAAYEAWLAAPTSVVYGESIRDGWNLAGESKLRLALLSASERRAAELVKTRLLKTEPASLAALEEKAALGRLQELGALHSGEGQAFFSGRSVTLAAQYALEALGFVEFVNGPDNDYGPSTIEAARKAQAHYGNPETRWLSHQEVRQMLCDAATQKSDPISYYHLAIMFSQGWGFRQDVDRAAFAIDQAGKILESRLANADALPAWKRAHYPTFRPLIERADAAIDEARDAAAQSSGGERVGEDNLCR